MLRHTKQNNFKYEVTPTYVIVWTHMHKYLAYNYRKLSRTSQLVAKCRSCCLKRNELIPMQFSSTTSTGVKSREDCEVTQNGWR